MKKSKQFILKLLTAFRSFIALRTKVISDIFKSAGLAIILVVILKDELANEFIYTLFAIVLLVIAIYFGKEEK